MARHSMEWEVSDLRTQHALADDPLRGAVGTLDEPPDAPRSLGTSGAGRDEAHGPSPFDEAALSRIPAPVPAHGWRRAVARLSRHALVPAPSPAEREALDVVARIQRRVTRPRTITVLSTKGGTGKTTTALGLASTLARYRPDRVVALDGNPDAGTLAYRVPRQSAASARDLLDARDAIVGYSDLRAFVQPTTSRLEVVASPDDPHESRMLGREEYHHLLALLRRHYSVVVVDCGTGIVDAATRGIVEVSDQVVVVAAPTVDSTRAAAYLLTWLAGHGFADLVEQAVVVVNNVPARPGQVDVDAIERHLSSGVRASLRVPHDPHLATGAQADHERLLPRTRDAYLRLAALVADGFPDL